jgi:radical SAM superfamily enzyme YgiQ (UPF0313 family)
MTPTADANEHGAMELPSYGVRRILAAVLADPALKGVQVALIEAERPDVNAYVEAIERFEPDLIGMSLYVWSTPCLVEVARRLKQRRPERPIVFRGRAATSTRSSQPRAKRCFARSHACRSSRAPPSSR